jgi:hypothetical protein
MPELTYLFFLFEVETGLRVWGTMGVHLTTGKYL